MKSGSRVRVRSWKWSKCSFGRGSLYCCSLSSTSSDWLMPGRVPAAGRGGRGRPGAPPAASFAGMPRAAGGEGATYDDLHGGVDRTVSPPTPGPQCAGRRSTGGLYRGRMADVEAHITGTVWKIEVAVGDRVEEGDTVAILESMKMEMAVEAEDPGTVARILVEEGQAVSEGDALVVLE